MKPLFGILWPLILVPVESIARNVTACCHSLILRDQKRIAMDCDLQGWWVVRGCAQSDEFEFQYIILFIIHWKLAMQDVQRKASPFMSQWDSFIHAFSYYFSSRETKRHLQLWVLRTKRFGFWCKTCRTVSICSWICAAQRGGKLQGWTLHQQRPRQEMCMKRDVYNVHHTHFICQIYICIYRWWHYRYCDLFYGLLLLYNIYGDVCYVDIVLRGDPRDLYLIIPVHKLFQCRFSETIHENPGVLPGQQWSFAAGWMASSPTGAAFRKGEFGAPTQRSKVDSQ